MIADGFQIAGFCLSICGKWGRSTGVPQSAMSDCPIGAFIA
jgi:hypothetical protein